MRNRVHTATCADTSIEEVIVLEPFFGRDCDLVVWIEEGQHIFDVNMDWVAYLSVGHA